MMVEENNRPCGCSTNEYMNRGITRRWKAGYTVEASIIVPLTLWVMALTMKTGIVMYEEVVSRQEQTAIADMWEVDEFYTLQAVKEVLND